jgi:hypothetical protein
MISEIIPPLTLEAGRHKKSPDKRPGFSFLQMITQFYKLNYKNNRNHLILLMKL